MGTESFNKQACLLLKDHHPFTFIPIPIRDMLERRISASRSKQDYKQRTERARNVFL